MLKLNLRNDPKSPEYVMMQTARGKTTVAFALPKVHEDVSVSMSRTERFNVGAEPGDLVAIKKYENPQFGNHVNIATVASSAVQQGHNSKSVFIATP